MKASRWDEAAIRAADFAGIVPASRGIHPPLHPRLASLCCPRRAMGIGRGAFRRAEAGGRGRSREPRPGSGRRAVTWRRSVRVAGDSKHTTNMFQLFNIIN